jgi:hypothetical protein
MIPKSGNRFSEKDHAPPMSEEAVPCGGGGVNYQEPCASLILTTAPAAMGAGS